MKNQKWWGLELGHTFLGRVGGEWPHFSFTVGLTRGESRYSTPYTQGMGFSKLYYEGERSRADARARKQRTAMVPEPRMAGCFRVPDAPEIRSVLECLQTDCRSGEHLLFEDFASEFGYDTDSRKAEATWRTCQETRGRMQRLLGADFDDFMNHDFDE